LFFPVLLFTSFSSVPCSGVARIGARRVTKLRENNFQGDTEKYDEIHAINSDKAVLGQHIFTGYRQPHGVECLSLCGSEVTRKIKQSEVEGEGNMCSSAP